MSEDVLKLLTARAAAMAEHDGVAVAVVHIFGASNDIVADVGTARDALIGKPGLLADVLSDIADAEATDLDKDLDIDPVAEARRIADEATAAALAAAERADQLTAEADRLQAEKDKEAADKAAAEAAAQGKKRR